MGRLPSWSRRSGQSNQSVCQNEGRFCIAVRPESAAIDHVLCVVFDDYLRAPHQTLERNAALAVMTGNEAKRGHLNANVSTLQS